MFRRQLKEFVEDIHQVLDKKLDIHDDDTPFLLTMLLSFIFFAVALWAFLELTGELLGEELDTLDEQVFQEVFAFRSAGLTDFMRLVTDFGDTTAYIVVTLIICGFFYYIFRNWKYISQVSIVLILSSLINIALKELFNRPRPETAGQLVEVHSLSYPSGHAMSAMAFYGFLIYLAWRLLRSPWFKIGITIVCSAIILAIGLSRVYLGVHYPSDVVGGFLGGLIWLALCIIIFNLFSLLRIRKFREKEVPDSKIEEHAIKHE